MPMSFVALPHSTGNTEAEAMPFATSSGKLLGLDVFVLEIPLHQIVVADDDPLDERVVNRMLFERHLRRDRFVEASNRTVRVDCGVVVQ